MDAMIARVQEHGGDLPALKQYLDSQKTQIQSNANAILNAVQALDLERHSMACLYLLEAKAATDPHGADAGQLIDVTCRFLSACAADQIKVAHDRFVALCRAFKDACIASGQPRRAVLPLLAALRKLQPSRTCLTPIHADFCQVCLLSKVYNAAQQVLDDDILDVEPSKTSMRPTDLLLYCLYGGMICTGRKRYERALQLYLVALTAPTMVVNAITMAVYKKYVLVSLLHKGSVNPLPKYTSSVVQRGIKSGCEPYTAFANGFAAKSHDELATLATTHSATYQQDHNIGLVQQVLEAQRKRDVHKLTQAYLTLPLADIAQRINAPSADEAELYILRMVDNGDMHARVSDAAEGAAAAGGMVRFLEPPREYDTPEAVERVRGLLDASVDLAQQLAAANHLVSCDASYLGKTYVSDRQRRYEEPDFGSEPDLQSFAFKP